MDGIIPAARIVSVCFIALGLFQRRVGQGERSAVGFLDGDTVLPVI